jgi:hypothetical protein
MNITNHISKGAETIFWVKISKLLDADPEWKTFRSGINIPDPQHLNQKNQRCVQASKKKGRIQIEMNGSESTRLPAGRCEFPVHAPPPHLALLVLKKNMLKKTIRCVVKRLQ